MGPVLPKRVNSVLCMQVLEYCCLTSDPRSGCLSQEEGEEGGQVQQKRKKSKKKKKAKQ